MQQSQGTETQGMQFGGIPSQYSPRGQMHVPAMLGEVCTSPQDPRGLQMSTVHHQPRPSSKPMGSIDATSDATDAGPASIHHQFSGNDLLHQEPGTTYQTFGTLHEASGGGSYTPDALTFTGSPPPNTNQYQYPGSGATTRGFAPTASAGGPVHHGIGHNQGSYTQDPPQFTGSPPPNTNQYQYPRTGATTRGFAPTASAGGPVHYGIGHNWGSYTQDPPQFTGSPPPNTNQYQYPRTGATTRGFAPTASAGGPVHYGIGHNRGSYTQDPPNSLEVHPQTPINTNIPDQESFQALKPQQEDLLQLQEDESILKNCTINKPLPQEVCTSTKDKNHSYMAVK